jgi:hypothetical protein
LRIVRQVWKNEWVKDKRVVHGDQQRVAIGRRARNGLCADAGIAAGLVLDNDRLSPLLTEVLSIRSSHQIGGTARRKGHHYADRPTWEIRWRCGTHKVHCRI